ncbi:MAG TPA: ASCH domain-containing protein, partial [Bacteroidia bacterium]
IKKEWFDAIASGEKKEEFRNRTTWIESRLVSKEDPDMFIDYDTVLFQNGYNKNSPRIEVEYLGCKSYYDEDGEYFAILLGKIIKK